MPHDLFGPPPPTGKATPLELVMRHTQVNCACGVSSERVDMLIRALVDGKHVWLHKVDNNHIELPRTKTEMQESALFCKLCF